MKQEWTNGFLFLRENIVGRKMLNRIDAQYEFINIWKGTQLNLVKSVISKFIEEEFNFFFKYIIIAILLSKIFPVIEYFTFPQQKCFLVSTFLSQTGHLLQTW